MNTRQEWIGYARDWAGRARQALGDADDYAKAGWVALQRQALDRARDCIRIGNERCDWVEQEDRIASSVP
jgi:hypothetical protein